MNNRAHLLQLIGRLVDGSATEEEVRALDALLRADKHARREFLRYLNVDTALEDSALALRILDPRRSTPWKVTARKRMALAVTTAAAVILTGFLFLARPNRADRAVPPPDSIMGTPSRTQVTEAPFALLAAANEAVWADPNVELALRAGELPPGLLRLETGLAEFICADGATVVLQGPGAIRFPERKRVYIESGRILCRCTTEASRLSVQTPDTEILDLGTEFSVAALADRTTRVAVLSGEVQVGKAAPRLLRKGEALEVRGDGMLEVQALAQEEFSRLLPVASALDQALEHGVNQLRDPGFEEGFNESTWSGTESNLETTPRGRSGAGVRVCARGNAHWPICRQTVPTRDMAGRLVMASVWAAVPPEDPLGARQRALLKIAFKNKEGRDFAFAVKRFAGPDSVPGKFERVQLAAFVPEGTDRVQLQLLVQSDLKQTGSVVFDDASLVIRDPAP